MQCAAAFLAELTTKESQAHERKPQKGTSRSCIGDGVGSTDLRSSFESVKIAPVPISKRAIAREWLIFILLFPLGGFTCYYLGYACSNFRTSYFGHYYFRQGHPYRADFDDFWNDVFGLANIQSLALWLIPYLGIGLLRSIAWSITTLKNTGKHEEPLKIDRPEHPQTEHVEQRVKPHPQPPIQKEQVAPDRKKQRRTVISTVLFCLSFAGFVTFAALAMPEQQVQRLTELYLKVMLGAVAVTAPFARKGHRTFASSIACTVGTLIFIGFLASARFQARSENQKLAHSVEAFSADSQHFVEQGGTTGIPKAAYTGNAQNDAVIRVMNDGVQAIFPIVQKLNNDLGALETGGDAFSQTLNADRLRKNAQIEARKRIKAQEVIANARADLKRALDEFVQGASTRYASTGHGQEIQQGIQKGLAGISSQYEEMFQLLETKAKAEFNLYEFLSTQEFTNGAVSFLNAADREKYHQLLALSESSAKDIEAFRKQAIEKAKESAKKLEALR